MPWISICYWNNELRLLTLCYWYFKWILKFFFIFFDRCNVCAMSKEKMVQSDKTALPCNYTQSSGDNSVSLCKYMYVYSKRFFSSPYSVHDRYTWAPFNKVLIKDKEKALELPKYIHWSIMFHDFLKVWYHYEIEIFLQRNTLLLLAHKIKELWGVKIKISSRNI